MVYTVYKINLKYYVFLCHFRTTNIDLLLVRSTKFCPHKKFWLFPKNMYASLVPKYLISTFFCTVIKKGYPFLLGSPGIILHIVVNEIIWWWLVNTIFNVCIIYYTHFTTCFTAINVYYYVFSILTPLNLFIASMNLW